MSDIAIRVENLSKQYTIGRARERHDTLRDALVGIFRRNGSNGSTETFWALKDVSFEVKRGEVVGIIGRNGAGKSTLLKVLSQITEPTGGRAEIHGRVGSLLEVGTGFHPELTGRENIYLNGAILGMRREEIARQFDEIVAFSEIEKFLDTPVKRYSSGMYVRLAFAVAAHLEPEILLVDEVLAVGDAAFQKKALGKMGSVVNEGRTVLFVSHNMGAINSLCSQTIYLAGGALKMKGPTAAVVGDYLSAETTNAPGDLDSHRVPGFDGSVLIRHVSINSEDNQAIPFGSELQFKLLVWSGKNRKNLSIGISLYNGSGSCLGSAITTDEFDLQQDQTVMLTLTVAKPILAPGRYTAGFSVGFGGYGSNRADYEAVIGMPYFQVLPTSISGEFISNWNPAWGDTVLECKELVLE